MSPFILAPTLEPLLNKVRLNPDIKGFCVGTGEHKLPAYADDVLFYVADPLISLPNIMAELQGFSLLSNFKINYSKFELLSLNMEYSVYIGITYTAAILVLLYLVSLFLKILRGSSHSPLLSAIHL